MSHSTFGIKHQKGSVEQLDHSGIPLLKWVIKSGELTVGISMKAKMRLYLNYVPTVLICLGSHGLAHAKDAL
jgi:hypothetical protein